MDARTEPRPGARPGPVGAYRRAFRISADGPVAIAAMEDDVHHFEVTVRAEDGVIRSVRSEAHRTPWTTCPGAVAQLRTLEGVAVADVAHLPATAKIEHCTHLFDLAVLAASHVGKRGFERRYRLEVDHDVAPPRATLWRDGVEVLSWGVDRRGPVGSRFDGVPFSDLARHLGGLDRDEVEAALILRRASLISFVRTMDLDVFARAQDVSGTGPANCFAKRGGRWPQGERNVGSTRDFAGKAAWPLEPAAPDSDPGRTP